MISLTDRAQGELFLDLLLGALRVGDEQLNALATELLRRCGQAPIRRLVREAFDRKNRPPHRVRALQAIRRIGRVTDLTSQLDLFALTQDKHPAVRSAAVQLLSEMGRAEADLAE